MASGSRKEYKYLKPSEIRFTQDSISSRFAKTNRTLTTTLEMLLMNGIPKRDVPMIKVVQRGGQWWSLDNRRLWVFKELEKRGGCRIIKVQVVAINESEWKRKFTTKNNGESVHIRPISDTSRMVPIAAGFFSDGGADSDSDEDLV